MGLVLHPSRDDSVPLHTTLSKRISPLPLPKYAPPSATEPMEKIEFTVNGYAMRLKLAPECIREIKTIDKFALQHYIRIPSPSDLLNPNCLHTTPASTMSQKSSQMLPYALL